MNRLKSETSMRLRQTLDALTSGVAVFQQQMQSGFETPLAVAIADARKVVPAHRAVSDEDLRRDVRLKVRRAWLDDVQRSFATMKTQAESARELLRENARAARVLPPPVPPAGASSADRTAFQLELLNVRLEYPKGTPLLELWDAFISADENGTAMQAGYLENAIEHELTHGAPNPGNTHDALRVKRERDTVRQQLEARRDRRASASDRENLAAWDRELIALESHLSAANQALIAHARAA